MDMKGKAMGGELIARNFFVGKITGETKKRVREYLAYNLFVYTCSLATTYIIILRQCSERGFLRWFDRVVSLLY